MRGPSAEDDWAAMVALCNRDDAKSDRGYKTLAAAVRRNPKEQKPCSVVRTSFVCGRPFEAFWSQHELERRVIVDLGCVKSVVGVKWMRALLTEWKAQQRWFRICPEKEVFQFGNGENLTSRYAVQYEAVIAGAHVIINLWLKVCAHHYYLVMRAHNWGWALTVVHTPSVLERWMLRSLDCHRHLMDIIY